MVENIHFRFESSTWEDVGHKSLAVNLSDIAAMGGQPLYALVSLACPGDVDVESVLDFYRGMTRLASQHSTAIVGGNMAASPVVSVSVFVTGEAPSGKLLRRSSALPGQLIAVTGALGAAATAIAALKSHRESDSGVPAVLMQALLRPCPRLMEAQVLVEEGVCCAIDISDGLVADLGHICERSKVTARVYASQIPVCPACQTVTPDSLDLALYGGEDYELLFTCDSPTLERVAARLDCPVTVVGEIGEHTAQPEIAVIGPDGQRITRAQTGWNHFGK
jgi:thiamine-monophosphate kinase